MSRTLTEKQKLFLEYLFHPDNKGSAYKAKIMAGYAPEYATSSIIKSLKDEILEATRDFMVANGPKAALAISSAIDEPDALGIKYKLTAAKDILDRAGIVKTEKMEIATSGLFILPMKEKDE